MWWYNECGANENPLLILMRCGVHVCHFFLDWHYAIYNMYVSLDRICPFGRPNLLNCMFSISPLYMDYINYDMHTWIYLDGCYITESSPPDTFLMCVGMHVKWADLHLMVKCNEYTSGVIQSIHMWTFAYGTKIKHFNVDMSTLRRS